MLSFLSKIIKFNNLMLLGIYKKDDAFTYYTLTVKKKGNTLSIVSSAIYDDLESLLKDSNTRLPVVLLIDGKGVLNKRIDIKNDADITWKKNVDFTSIYFTEVKTPDAGFMSFSRKKNIDDIILQMQQNKLQIVDFYLGPLLSSLLQKTIAKQEIVSGDTVLLFENDSLSEIKKQNTEVIQNYTFSESILSQHHLPLYGAALHFFLKSSQVSKNESESITTENIIYQKSFNYFGVGMLGIFFIALLTSYVLIQYYLGENAKLNEQNIFSYQTYEYIVNLEKQREQKLEILNKTGQLSKKFLSFYVYELSKSAPSSISLTNLEIFPVPKEIKPNEKVNIVPNLIMVKGFTGSGPSLDNWLNELKKMKWIKKFEIVSIKKDKKNIQQFELKILLNNV
ncbi:hypothetical protein [Flavobacterium sp. NRK1]|uniref:hypothetical protein n=1 Tax=Flavobacterium sp. NRK1 TaxID=2954929 RepID=UPI0020933276|nr:hypothetical protein [Flavobacterium sp. NRK1]MCO6147915.1 hypothetical protein [Flavobacterium sp. NRK1]